MHMLHHKGNYYIQVPDRSLLSLSFWSRTPTRQFFFILRKESMTRSGGGGYRAGFSMNLLVSLFSDSFFLTR